MSATDKTNKATSENTAKPSSPFPIKGWCPGLMAPMEAADGFIIRVKPRLATFSSTQLNAIGDVAERFSAPTIELTNKANIQLRGVDQADIPEIIQYLREFDLVDDSDLAERRRSIVVDPSLLVDELRPQMTVVYQALEQLLRTIADDIVVPAKFTWLIENGASSLMANAFADVRVILNSEQTNASEQGSGLTIQLAFGGERGNAVVLEQTSDHYSLATELSQALQAAFDTSHDYWLNRADRQRFKPYLTQKYAVTPASKSIEADVLNIYQDLATQNNWGLLGLAFGEFTVSQWRALVELTAKTNTDESFITPHRLFVLPSLTQAETNQILRELKVEESEDLPKLNAFLHDGSFAVHACVGAPRCDTANGESRSLLTLLQPYCENLLDGSLNLHISACVKACAHRNPSELTILVAEQGYQLGLNARPNGELTKPMTLEQLATTLAQLDDEFVKVKQDYANAKAFVHSTHL